MRDLIVTMVVFASLPFILKRPYLGILMWAWIGYMNPHRMGWGFASTMPFAMIIAVTTLTGMFFSKEKMRIPWERETVILVVFIAWMGITTIFAVHHDLAVEQYIKVLKIQFMTFVTMMLISDRKRMDWLVWAIVLSLGFYGVKGGIFTLLSGGSSHVVGPPGTFIEGNNELALALVITVPLMRYLQLQTDRRWVSYGLGAAMALTMVAILGSQSRGGLLGLLAMLSILAWKSPKRITLISVLIVILPLALMFMPDSWHNRMSTIQTYEQDGSALGRINAWWMATNLVMDRPLVGGGFESFSAVMFARYAPEPLNVHSAHSIYFQVLGEHGFVGLAIFLLLGLLLWRSCSSIVKEVGTTAEILWLADLARMVQVSLVGFSVSGAFLGLAYFDLFYHLMAIVVVMKYMCKQSLLSQQENQSLDGYKRGRLSLSKRKNLMRLK